MSSITTQDLLADGVYFGHQMRRWNPKMKKFIVTDRNGIYIIDLMQTVEYMNKAFDFVKNTVASGGSILFVGTKRQAQEIIKLQATRVGQPYVSERWLGGMLTNFQTISKRLGRLKDLEGINFDDTSSSAATTKKELLLLRREKDKLSKTLGGIRDMNRLPSAIWVVDTIKEHLAVDEARKLGIPVVAIADTNCDPDMIDYLIPGNDDAIRSVDLLTKFIADAIAAGLLSRSEVAAAMAKRGEEDATVEAEPMADWEKELLGATEDSNSPEKKRIGDMVNYTAADIKLLRETTGAGMLDVKNALVEADGDKARATEILRIKGAKAAAKRGERETAEGLIASKIVQSKSGKGQAGYIIELDSETDFVAKSPDFVELANTILEAVVAADANDLESALAAKTAAGTVKDKIEEVAGMKLRENLVLKNAGKVEGEAVVEYLHKKDAALPPYVGVVVGIDGVSEENAKKLAAHLASYLGINGSFPYTSIDDVPSAVIESEERIAREKNQGKPDEIMQKIVAGALNNFYKQQVLLEQELAFDSTVLIKNLLGTGKITSYVGFLVGGTN
jgi:small subunit ribosomal protein S2